MTDLTISNGTYDLTGSQGGTIAIGNGNDTVVVTGGSGQTIAIGNGNDALAVDGATGDTIKVGNGNDIVVAGGGSGNTIVAGNGNDIVVVSGDHGDRVTIGNGNDIVALGANDTATVGNGNDILALGANDTVTLGKGNDTLIVPSGSASVPTLAAPASITVLEDHSIGMDLVAALSGTGFGQETIYGLRSSDKLVVGTEQFANFAAVLADARQVGQNTIISADPSDTITLENFQLSSLKSGNVVFTNDAPNGAPSATLSLTISGLPADATLSSAADPGGVSYNAATKTWSIAAGALPDLTLKAGEVTTATVTVTATDSATGASISRTIALTVDPAAPTLTAPASLSVKEEGTVALGIAETPFDPRDLVSLTITGVPADATLSAGTRNSDGSWTLTPAQLSNLTLQAGEETSTTLTVTATNTLGATASVSQTISLTVTPPTLSVAISGIAQDGLSLTAVATVDVPNEPVAFQWQSSGDGTTWTNISGASSATYLAGEHDEGNFIRVEATLTDDNTPPVFSAATARVAENPNEALVNVLSGLDSGGNAVEGQAITVTASDADDPPGFVYTWQTSRDGGTTWTTVQTGPSDAYTPTEADENAQLREITVFTDDSGNTETGMSSAGTVVPSAEAPIVIVPSTLTVTEGGTVALAISVTPFDADDDVIASVTIAGVPSDMMLSAGTNNGDGTWTLSPDQLANLTVTANGEETATPVQLTVTATATEAGAPSPATSAPQTIALTVVDVPPTLSVTITGTPRENSTLLANAVSNDADATFTYQWQSSGDGGTTWSAIAGATAQTYQLQEGDENKLIDVVVTSQDAAGSGTSATSAPTTKVLDNSSLSVAIGVAGNGPVAEGQQLFAGPTIGDTDDAGIIPSYQWQSSSNGGLTWQPVSGATASGNQSFYQITEADEGKQFQVIASYTDETGQLVSATSATTVKAGDVTPLITPQFSYALDELSIVKNGSEIYDDTFGQAPPQSPTILSNGSPVPVTYLTQGSTWTDVGGKAILSSSGTTELPPGPGVLARLTTNTDPTSNLGLKANAAFTISATFDLVRPSAGSYGLELNDGTSTHANDQDVQIRLNALANGNTRVGLYQADFTQSPPVFTLLGNVDLTPAQLAGATQIEFDLSHAANSTAITGQFKLLDNGSLLSTTAVGGAGSIFTNGVDWTRADVFGSAPATVLVSGTPQEGQTLTANAATNDADATLHYQWQSSSDGGTTWNDISGATASTYTLQDSDEGLIVRAEAFTTDADNNTTAQVFSTATATVAAAPEAPALSVPSQITASSNGSVALPISAVGDADDATSVTISGIPADASLSDSAGPLTVVNGSVRLTSAQLAGLSLHAGATPANLTVTATNAEGGGASTSDTVLLTVKLSGAALWGTAAYPVQPTTGTHLYAPAMNTNATQGFAGMLIGTTASDYNPAGPDVVTDSIVTFDPFMLPENGSPSAFETSTISSFPFRYQIQWPRISGTQAEGIAVYETQDGSGDSYLNRVVVTRTDANSPLSFGAPTQIEGPLTGKTENPVIASFRNNSDGSLDSYSVAWDQYDATAGTYTVNFQVFNPDGSTASPIETPISLTGVTGGVTSLPATFLRAGAGGYALAHPIVNANGTESVQITGFNVDGTSNGTNITIGPSLGGYAAGAKNTITLEQNPATHTLVTSALQYAQFSAATGNEYAVGWNETVTDANGTHDQVEFAIFKPGSGVVSRTTFQIADGLPQDIKVQVQNDVAVLEYGDNNTTTVREFNSTGAQVGSLTVATTQAAQNILNFGDGRIGIVYDNQLDSSGTSQIVTDVYDFRTSGVNTNDSGLADGVDKYVAGTQFNDTFVGENNVNNTYAFVGSATGGSPPTDSFTGGGGGWNVAIMPDDQSNYTIAPSGGTMTLTNTGDPSHAGSLALDNVQAIAWDPASDPSGNPGSLTATGSRLEILGQLPNGGEPITIADGATLELHPADSGSVSFAGSTGALQLDQFAGFTGSVAGFGAQDQLDLRDLVYDPNTAAASFSGNGAGGTLTVTSGATSASIVFSGDYTGTNFVLASDGHGGTLLTDPSAPKTAPLAPFHS